MHSNNYNKSSTHEIDDDSSDGNGNDQWTPDTDADPKDDYIKDYSSDADDMKIKKKRIRKKGRKAKFLVEQMIYDQQVLANQQRMMQFQQPQPVVVQPIPQPPVAYCQQNYTPNFIHSLPDLETVGENHIPGIFDVVPRGQM